MFLGLSFAAANANLPGVMDEHLGPLAACLAAQEAESALATVA